MKCKRNCGDPQCDGDDWCTRAPAARMREVLDAMAAGLLVFFMPFLLAALILSECGL